MPKITQLKPQKNKKRVNVYLDGKFAFGIDLENLVKANLKVEQELAEKEIEEIVKKAEFQKTLNKLLKFATLRPRSKKEIDYWLRRKKVHQSLHQKLFKRLNNLDLIDDQKFAQWWVNQRNSFRPRSKRQLIQELRQKGIVKEIIDQTLEETEIDETKIAKELIKKREYQYQKLDRQTKKRKITEYLARKGFNWETIKQLIDL